MFCSCSKTDDNSGMLLRASLAEENALDCSVADEI
jgi:hypothetical protein